MIDAKEIEFDPPETPNVIIVPMPNHDKGINSINVVEDADSDCDIDSWIFATTSSRLNNWKTEDFIPISFNHE